MVCLPILGIGYHCPHQKPDGWRCLFETTAALKGLMMQKRKTSLLAFAACMLSTAFAHAQFTAVINVPPSVAPTTIGSHTQVNVFDGGYLPYDFRAGSPNV